VRKYNVVSLFSGAMGLDIGLEKTGRFKLIACVELEKSFCETIRANQQVGNLPLDLQVVQADIADLSVSSFLETTGIDPEEVDVVVGGPPCQSFSTAGRRKGILDPRGTLLWDCLRFIEGLSPKFFLMENVRGLLSAALRHRPIAERPERGGLPLADEEQPGSVVRLFAQDLQKIAGGPYHMDCFEVNAVNYGAPQLRERAIFIGNRFGAQVDFPDPTHGVRESTDDLFSKDELLPWKTLGQALSEIDPDDDDVIMDFSPRKKRYLAMVPPGSNWRALPEAVQKESMGRAWFAKGGRSGWWRRLTADLPCPTLVTMPNHASTSLCHPTETRALTLREYLKIQEFPEGWAVCGRTTEKYAQIGNAVPVRLGEVAGLAVATKMDELAAAGWRIADGTSEDYRTVYVQAHVRTRQWFKKGETFVWSDGGENDEASYGAARTRRRVKQMVGARC
jgi:DNA (cytosine-5)-methyltransferase 1